MPQSKGKKSAASITGPPPPLPAALQAHEPTAQDVAEALALLAADPSLQECPSTTTATTSSSSSSSSFSSPSSPNPVPAQAPTSPLQVPITSTVQKDIVPEKGHKASAARFGSERIPSLGANRTNRHTRDFSPSQGPRRRFTPNTADQPCMYFRNKECRFGDKCRYSHDPSLFTMFTSSSSFSSSSSSSSTSTSSSSFSPSTTQGRDPSQEEDAPIPDAGSINKECVYWLSGVCRWGDICRYQHTEGKQGSQPNHHLSLPSSKRSNGSLPGGSRSFHHSSAKGPSTTSSSSSSPSRGKTSKSEGGGSSKSNGRRKRPQDQSKEARGSGAGAGGGRKPTEICRYWKSAKPCLWGEDCHFRHTGPQAPAPPSLHDFLTTQLVDASDLAIMMQSMSGLDDLNSLNDDLGSPAGPGVPRHMKEDILEGEEEEEKEKEDEGGIMGFTADEVMELLSQGVKPWDEDAHAVLEALNGNYGYTDDEDDFYYY